MKKAIIFAQREGIFPIPYGIERMLCEPSIGLETDIRIDDPLNSRGKSRALRQDRQGTHTERVGNAIVDPLVKALQIARRALIDLTQFDERFRHVVLHVGCKNADDLLQRSLWPKFEHLLLTIRELNP